MLINSIYELTEIGVCVKLKKKKSFYLQLKVSFVSTNRTRKSPSRIKGKFNWSMCSAKPIDGASHIPNEKSPSTFVRSVRAKAFPSQLSNKKAFFPERSPSASARNVSGKGTSVSERRIKKNNNTRMQAPSSVWFQSNSACLLEFDWSLPPEHRAREHRERVFMLDRGKEVNRLEIRFRDFKRKGGGDQGGGNCC